MIEALAERFSPKKNTAVPAAPVASVPAADPEAPCQCGCLRWWLPAGQSDWRCESCQPPPSRSLVARWSDATPRVTSEAWVTFCRPWCPSCGGWRGIERNYSDWSSELACATCGSELPEVPAVVEDETLEAAR